MEYAVRAIVSPIMKGPPRTELKSKAIIANVPITASALSHGSALPSALNTLNQLAPVFALPSQLQKT